MFFIFLDNSFNFSRLPPIFDIIFLGSPYPEKWLYMLSLGCLLIGLLLSKLLETCYDNLQYKGKFCYIGRTFLYQSPPMGFLEHHGVSVSPSTAFAEISGMLNSFLLSFSIMHLYISNRLIHMIEVSSSPLPFDYYTVDSFPVIDALWVLLCDYLSV